MSTAQGTTVLDKIRTRGHWIVVIRPATFETAKVRYEDLFPIIDRNSVQFRGWDYPHVSHQEEPQRGADWVGQEYDRDDSIEIWRFHTNGLFVHYFALSGDWRDQSNFWPAEPGWQPRLHIEYLDTIYTFLEIFEFAARLALSPAGSDRMHVEITIKDLQGRHLYSSGGHFRTRNNYTTQMPEWSYPLDLAQTELIAKPRDFAALAAQDFFARFGLNVSLETLRLLQEKIGR
jgi:hypothetical protein